MSRTYFTAESLAFLRELKENNNRAHELRVELACRDGHVVPTAAQVAEFQVDHLELMVR